MRFLQEVDLVRPVVFVLGLAATLLAMDVMNTIVQVVRPAASMRLNEPDLVLVLDESPATSGLRIPLFVLEDRPTGKAEPWRGHLDPQVASFPLAAVGEVRKITVRFEHFEERG